MLDTEKHLVYQGRAGFSVRIRLWTSSGSQPFSVQACPISGGGVASLGVSHIAMSLIVDEDSEGI